MGLPEVRIPIPLKWDFHSSKWYNYVVKKDWDIYVNGEKHTVKEGFIFQNSSPDELAKTIPEVGPHMEAFCFHDWGHEKELHTRSWCDKSMKAIMYYRKVDEMENGEEIIRNMYWGVRISGYFCMSRSWRWRFK